MISLNMQMRHSVSCALISRNEIQTKMFVSFCRQKDKVKANNVKCFYIKYHFMCMEYIYIHILVI